MFLLCRNLCPTLSPLMSATLQNTQTSLSFQIFPRSKTYHPSRKEKTKKFIYKVVKEGARAREYEDAWQWLVDARLVHKIFRSTAPGLPMSSYDDLSSFKIYLVDVGLLRRLAQLAPTAFGEGNRLFTEFKGALTENFGCIP